MVVQDTGPSAFLPNGEGMFRFTTPRQAARALEAINADYERHSQAARKLAETYFDAKQVMAKILGHALNDNALARKRRQSPRPPSWTAQRPSSLLRRHDSS